MAAATDILNAVKAGLEAAFPGVYVDVRRHPVEPDVDPYGGRNPGDPAEFFVVSCSDPEDVDGAGSFELISVEYVVRVDHVRAVVPGERADDPANRDARAAIRAALHRPYLAGFTDPAVLGRVFRPGLPAQTRAASGSRLATVSSEAKAYLTWEPRLVG